MRIILAFMASLLISYAAYPAELFGTVDAISGSANVIDQSGKSTAISVGQTISEGQTIESGADGEVHLVTEDGGIIAVRPNTVFRVDEYKAEGDSNDKMFMSLLKGAIRSITGWVGKHNTAAYRLNTPTATIGIRGTDHETTVIDQGNGDEPGTYDSVNEGGTVMKTPHGSADVAPGKFAFAPKGKAVAPFFLAQRPHFLATRRLKIEDRIQQRKESLRGRLDQMRNERIQKLRTIRENRRGTADKAGMRTTAMERRNGFQARRLERAGESQSSRRERFERRREDEAGGRQGRLERRQEAMNRVKENGNDNRRGGERRRRMMRD